MGDPLFFGARSVYIIEEVKGAHMEFWLVTSLLALVASVFMALALSRGHKNARPAGEFDLNVYRDQLAEVKRDAARGVISADDAERLQTEISRRILAADAASQAEQLNKQSPKFLQQSVAVALALTLIGGSFYLYRTLGAPGYGDLSLKTRIAAADKARAERPDQATAEANLPAPGFAPNASEDYIALVMKLREAVAKRPDDLQGAALLATHEMRLGNAVAAHQAQATVLRLKGEAASAKDYAEYADMLVIAAGGYVSPQAESALAKTLKRDPKNGVARYYSGLMMIQVGRPDVAFRAWATLLQDSPDDATWVTPIRAQIEDLAFRAGVKYELPALNSPALAGPTQDDIDNAADMSAQDRQDMIRGMVAQLSDRLATEGGSAQEWARLISALGVLGDADQAALIWPNAKAVFAGRDGDLNIVRDAARKLGITQ